MVAFNKKGDYIERKVKVNNSEIDARYYPKSGGFEFGKKGRFGKIKTELTGAGALATMGALVEAFKDTNPEKITYRAHGKTLKEAQIKDRLYERQLKNLGYQKEDVPYDGSTRDLVYSNGFHREGQTTECEWDGPKRLWLKHKDKGLEGTLAAASIISLVGIITFFSPSLTGNIVGLSNNFSDFMGALFFIIFLIATLSYFNIKKFI
jgi:hypothetical protein